MTEFTLKCSLRILSASILSNFTAFSNEFSPDLSFKRGSPPFSNSYFIIGILPSTTAFIKGVQQFLSLTFTSAIPFNTITNPLTKKRKNREKADTVWKSLLDSWQPTRVKKCAPIQVCTSYSDYTNSTKTSPSKYVIYSPSHISKLANPNLHKEISPHSLTHIYTHHHYLHTYPPI